ncbi:MAG: serpin family protein [Capsulimonas sp.]|uniref:serpin family protein n=1 Tax=Capsulimonas sp. TaxID=2494211 RepID=UPI0032660D87
MNVNASGRTALAASALWVLISVAAGAAPSSHSHVSKDNIAAASNAFGIDLLGKLVKANPDGNCFISPYSVQEALLLTDNGVSGASKTQIASVLHLSRAPLSGINAQAKAQRASLVVADPKVKIAVANALWASTSTKFNATYQETCRYFYNAPARTVALTTPAGAAAINSWVASKTQGHIKTIVPKTGLPRATSAVLTNAVYFHGAWTTPFPHNDTYPQDFHLTSTKTKKVPTMSRKGGVDYVKTSSYEAVALPYGGGRLRMIVVLPSQNSSVNAYLKSLTAVQWSALSSQLKPTQMLLFMPRVHTNYSASLKPALVDLGMHAPFTASNDFLLMGMPQKSYISDVLHKTTLDIDEDGTTASAATAIVIASLSIHMPPPVVVRIDRPFYCAIQDKQTGLVLFAGAIRNPG